MEIIPFDDRDGTIWLNGEMIPGGSENTYAQPRFALCQPCIRRRAIPTTAAF